MLSIKSTLKLSAALLVLSCAQAHPIFDGEKPSNEGPVTSTVITSPSFDIESVTSDREVNTFINGLKQFTKILKDISTTKIGPDTAPGPFALPGPYAAPGSIIVPGIYAAPGTLAKPDSLINIYLTIDRNLMLETGLKMPLELLQKLDQITTHPSKDSNPVSTLAKPVVSEKPGTFDDSKPMEPIRPSENSKIPSLSATFEPKGYY